MLSILTPTYNRSTCLPQIFKTLCQQTVAVFEWIIIDDGSDDDTEAMVAAWTKASAVSFPIRYRKKKNGGKHTAVNLGVQMAHGELVLILDSDDELPANAMEKITRRWLESGVPAADATCGGLAFCMAHRNGHRITTIGRGQTQQPIKADEIALRYQYGVRGDICEVFRTDVLREFPFPEQPGERFCPEQLVWFRIAQKYKLYFYEEVVYCRDYLESGLTANIVRIRMHSPVASCMTYAEMLGYTLPFAQKVKAAVNYFRFRHCMQIRNEHNSMVPRISWPWLVFWPIGLAMHYRDKL